MVKLIFNSEKMIVSRIIGGGFNCFSTSNK